MLIEEPISPDGPVISVIVHASAIRITALRQIGAAPPPPVQLRALIDSGASCTVIDKTVIQSLGLTPTGQTQIHTPSTGTTQHFAFQYDISLWFITRQPPPQGPFVPYPMALTLPVIEADFSAQNIRALIGRDLLDLCEFIYSGRIGKMSIDF